MKIKTNNNFNLAINILENQCFMTSGKAEKKAIEIFKSINELRKNGNKDITVDDLLIQEIEKIKLI